MKEKLAKIDKKTKIMVISFLLLIVIILFGGAFLYNKFFYKHSYQEIEQIMLNASKSYFEKNPNELPQTINGSITITEEELVNAEEMKSIKEYLKDETSTCEGNVNITNVNGKYRYVSYLNCGENIHSTKKLIDYVKEKDGITESGNGLYNLNNELVYRGENVNNYIKFSNKYYRIVKFTEEGQAVIVYTEKLDKQVWDNRYNVEKKNSVGINDYSVSRVREYLNNLYKGTTLMTEENKLLVTAHSLSIGKRKTTDTDKTGKIENSAIIENQYIGLLPLNDYLNASLDTNCSITTSPSCANYNYLSKYRYSWWTITANNKNTYQVFRVNANSSVTITNASNSSYIRPVLYLINDTIYVSGDGSLENPYIIK